MPNLLIEGPERYAAIDVAAAFAKALQTLVKAVETPRDRWLNTMQNMGFSLNAAKSLANMTTMTIEGELPARDVATRGSISLEKYIAELAHVAA